MNAYLLIKTIHNYWAYLVIIALAALFVRIFIGLAQKKGIGKQDRRISLVGLISLHIQLVLGIVLFLISPVTQTGMASFPDTMKNSFLRFSTVEHPVIMILGIVLFTIAHRKIKSAENFSMKLSLMYLFAITFLLIRIPYKTWLGI